MNYFGLFFSFLLPGIVIGLLMGGWICESRAAQRRARVCCRNVQIAHAVQTSCICEKKHTLYIHTVSDDHCHLAA